jgi:hypothetical protein
LLTLLATIDVQVGKYKVDLRKVKGAQVGDHNTQTNTFS